jgi:hypothetical protein
MRINYNGDTVFSAISFTRTLFKLRKFVPKMFNPRTHTTSAECKSLSYADTYKASKAADLIKEC